MRRACGIVSAVLLLAAVAGCMKRHLARMYEREFDCRDVTEIEDIGGGRFRVFGCGDSVVYQCIGRACAPQYREDGEGGEREAVARQGSEAKSAARRVEIEGGLTVVAMDLRLDRQTLLRMRAAPKSMESWCR